MSDFNLKEKYKKIWFNGKIFDGNDPKICVHPAAFALHYAKSVFEGIRFYKTDKGSAIFRLNEHTKRFFKSALIIKLKMPHTEEQINQAIVDIVLANGLEDGYIRPIAFAGPGPLGLMAKDNPTITAILVWYWGAYLGKEGMEKGVRLITSSITKDSASMFLKSKCAANYVIAGFAKEEAHDCGYDDAVHLDKNGLVAEASAANIFIASGGKLITPPLSAPILAGLTRDSIIQIARDICGYEVLERNFTRDELYSSDECFLCGTAVEVTPVREIDNRLIGTGQAGAISKQLQKIYLETVSGKIAKFEHWLTYIRNIYGRKNQKNPRESEGPHDLFDDGQTDTIFKTKH